MNRVGEVTAVHGIPQYRFSLAFARALSSHSPFEAFDQIFGNSSFILVGRRLSEIIEARHSDSENFE